MATPLTGVPDGFLAPLYAVQRLLERLDDQGTIIGGVAVSLLARPRATADIDTVVLASTDDLTKILTIAAQEG